MSQIHIVQRLSPGGIEQLVLALASHSDIRLFSLEGTTDSLVREWPALERFRARITGFGKRPGRDAGLLLRIAKQLRKLSPASVVTHHAGPLIYGGAAARLAGIGRLAHVEHDAWHLAAPRRNLVVRTALGLVRPRRIAVSGMVAEAAALHTGKAFEVIANGVDCERFRPANRSEARQRAGLPDNRRIVGAAGRLETVKGMDLLIRAAALLPEDVIVAIWGQGSQRPFLEELVDELGLAGRVILAGGSDRMEDVYPAMDVFCLPSRHEGLPLALLEAQACGIRAVARDVGGVREGLCPDTGILAACPGGPSDSEEAAPSLLATAILEALSVTPKASPRIFIESGKSLGDTLAAYKRLEREDHA